VAVVSAAAPPFYKNGFVVWCEETREGVIIDPGDEVEELLAGARASGVTVGAILLTHAHFDHITGVARVKAETHAAVWLHQDDLFLYEGIVEQARLFGIHATPQPRIDHFYGSGGTLRFGQYVVEVYHTPGHCPGGVCLAIGRAHEARRELFVGDTLFAGSIGRTDLPGGDPRTLLAAIRSVLLAFPDETVVHPGHGPSTTIGRERLSNPFLVEGQG
jgi:glyoxylase-like metal-dependent hydrolase (beta-lactamase superfamily II)